MIGGQNTMGGPPPPPPLPGPPCTPPALSVSVMMPCELVWPVGLTAATVPGGQGDGIGIGATTTEKPAALSAACATGSGVHGAIPGIATLVPNTYFDSGLANCMTGLPTMASFIVSMTTLLTTSCDMSWFGCG